MEATQALRFPEKRLIWLLVRGLLLFGTGGGNGLFLVILRSGPGLGSTQTQGAQSSGEGRLSLACAQSEAIMGLPRKS